MRRLHDIAEAVGLLVLLAGLGWVHPGFAVAALGAGVSLWAVRA